MEWRTGFRGTKITVLGLGVLGRGVNVAKFFAEAGAKVTVTDQKPEEELVSSVRRLKRYKNISFVLGRHRLSDFRRADFIIKAAGVPLDSPYVAEAKKHDIPVLMDASLFVRLAPEGVVFVGVTGTRGKSTVAYLIHSILCAAGRRAFLGGNIRGMATLPLLRKVRAGDTIVLELDSWQLQGFGDAKISPHIAVFTSLLPDHFNYYGGRMRRYRADKENIFKYQRAGDFLILGAQAVKAIGRPRVKSRVIVARKGSVPAGWRPRIPGEHNRGNIACARAACRILGVPEKVIQKGVEDFPGVPGRLQHIAKKKGVLYYNDTTGTTPDALQAALRALGDSSAKAAKNIVLIAGGSDKGLSYAIIRKDVGKTVKSLVLLEGTATAKIISALAGSRKKTLHVPVLFAANMREAVRAAASLAKRGDIVLFSPGAASFGMFQNEFDRGERFVKEVRKLP